MLAKNELVNKKVVQHNDLITSVAKMDKIPLKIFELAVSLIDVDAPPKDHTIFLSKKTLFAFFDVNDTNKHHRFKNAIERMQKQAYFVIKKDDDTNGVYFESIVPIPYVRWNSYDDKVKIRFDVDIMPYLLDLKSNFTQYAISDIMNLNSKYAVILYKWLSMNFNQFEYYEFKQKRTKEQLKNFKNPIITIKELRVLTDTIEEYSRFTNFEKRVLEQPILEINEHTHFEVTYEKIKKGRSIDSIQFFIKKKKIADNPFYKEEEKDPAYLKEKENIEDNRLEMHMNAQKNPYTQLLITNRLLEFKDILDLDIMLEIAQSVYPLYDELVKLTNDSERVNTHMTYVNDKKKDYTHKNKPKYLRKAIKDYLMTIKLLNS